MTDPDCVPRPARVLVPEVVERGVLLVGDERVPATLHLSLDDDLGRPTWGHALLTYPLNFGRYTFQLTSSDATRQLEVSYLRTMSDETTHYAEFVVLR